MTKRTKYILTAAAVVLLLLALWYVRPMPLMNVLKLNDTYRVDGSMSEPEWIKNGASIEKNHRQSYDLEVDAGSEAANALLELVEDIECRRKLPLWNFMRPRTLYDGSESCIELEWRSPEENNQVRLSVFASRSVNFIYMPKHVFFVLDHDAYDRFAQIFETYGTPEI